MKNMEIINACQPAFHDDNEGGMFDLKTLQETWATAVSLCGKQFIGPPFVEPHHEKRSDAPPVPFKLTVRGNNLYIFSRVWASGLHPRLLWALMSAWSVHGGDPFSVQIAFAKDDGSDKYLHERWDVVLERGWGWLYEKSRGWERGKQELTRQMRIAVTSAASAYTAIQHQREEHQISSEDLISIGRSKAETDAAVKQAADFVDIGRCVKAITKRLRKQEKIYSRRIGKDITQIWQRIPLHGKDATIGRLVSQGACFVHKTEKGNYVLTSKIYEGAEA
jgi:hypothetical protein